MPDELSIISKVISTYLKTKLLINLLRELHVRSILKFETASLDVYWNPYSANTSFNLEITISLHDSFRLIYIRVFLKLKSNSLEGILKISKNLNAIESTNKDKLRLDLIFLFNPNNLMLFKIVVPTPFLLVFVGFILNESLTNWKTIVIASIGLLSYLTITDIGYCNELLKLGFIDESEGEIVILAKILNKFCKTRLIKSFGKCCYSIYLFHFPLIKLFDPLIIKATDLFHISGGNGNCELRLLIFTPIFLLITLVIGKIFFNYVEFPAVQFSKNIISKYY